MPLSPFAPRKGALSRSERRRFVHSLSGNPASEISTSPRTIASVSDQTTQVALHALQGRVDGVASGPPVGFQPGRLVEVLGAAAFALLQARQAQEIVIASVQVEVRDCLGEFL